MTLKLHYMLCEGADPNILQLAERLTARFGGVATPQEADVIVSIGGDGMTLRGLSHSFGKVIYGLIPDENTTSKGYAVNRYKEGDDLIADIQSSTKFPLHPIIAQIKSRDGTIKTVLASNEIFVKPHETDEAALLTISGTFNGHARTEERIFCDGVMFSSPKGSTGWSHSYHGPVIPLGIPAYLMTFAGAHPKYNPVIGGADASFSVDIINTRGKRPMRVAVDSISVKPESPENPFVSVDVRLGKDPYAILAVKNPTQLHPFRRWAA